MSPRDDVKAFLGVWERTMEDRDIEVHANLYLRHPSPLVVFSDGHLMGDWLDVRVRLQRDFERVQIRRVEVHDLVVREIAPDVIAACFQYDLHVRDVWGTDATGHRIANMVLARTKDGLRIASAHFSDRRE